ncbi:MAG: Heparinase II/III-like protein [bacterium ADurb.Bin478]|nr:MAG: Heparinase II/III-like protein [bacterium ADurb.Bin478]
MLFNAANREKILALKDTDPGSAEVYKAILKNADAILQSKTYVNFPKNDNKAMNYMPLGEDLTLVGFAYALTGDEKYAGVLERLTTMASWPKGGKSGPEGIVSMKWNTHLTEFMGLLYDWLYDKLTPRQRAIVKESLEWRLDYTLNNFAYRQKNGTIVNRGSIAAQCGSHPYQNIMAILPGALAICDESAIARETLEVGLHYITGIANGHGEDEAWMDGPGYGNGKMKWLVNATWPLLTAMPELHLEKNEAYSAYTDFFAHLTPIGARHCSFGNRGYNETDWSASRTYNFRSMAMLRGDSHAMQNWLDTVRRLQEIDRAPSRNLYIEYVLPAYFTEPSPKPEDDGVGLFPLEGWISASSAPPSDYDAQREAVSMVFACRPRGGAGHSFRNENAFDIHAYGETLASGGCSTYNLNKYANDAMSHNTVLIDGQGHQYHDGREGTNMALAQAKILRKGRRRHLIYWSSDATHAYALVNPDVAYIQRSVFILPDIPLVVVVDTMEKKDKESIFSSRWHVENSDGNGRLRVHDNGFVVHRPNAKLYAVCSDADECTIHQDAMPVPPQYGVYPYVQVDRTKAARRSTLTLAAMPLPADRPEPVIAFGADGLITIDHLGRHFALRLRHIGRTVHLHREV